MAVVFTPYDDPKPGNQLVQRTPNLLREVYGTLNVGTHAAGGVEITIAHINNGFTNTQEQISEVVRVDPLGRSVDGTCGARWVDTSGKFQVFLEDGTSGVHADAGTANLSSANKTFDVRALVR